MSTEDAELPRPPRVEGPPPHLLVVRAPYYREVIEGLHAGAARILGEAGATHEVIDVAGAFELPQAIRLALRAAALSNSAARQRFDGYVALGCVVRGDTDHYDHICREAMAGLMQVALTYGIALGTGLLTVETLEQARARARTDGFNKGAEAAAAALRQIDAGRRLRAF
jgi:6,7-dimethyl-8-ribityllumazine synthase